MNNPKVSIIMSVYNGEPYLVSAIESILNQTFGDFEFIIIDDGSTDQTWSILSSYATKDPRIILIRNENNIGYTRSLNLGIKQSRGNYIARQDADDISHPDRLAKQVAFLEKNIQVGLVGTFPEFIDTSGKTLPVSDYPFIQDNANIQKKLLDMNCIRHGSVMIRQHWLDVVGLYNVELEPSEDYDLWLRLAEVTQLENIPESLYIYREHPNSESSKRRQRQIENKAIALERAIYRRFGPNPPPESLKFVARDYLRAAVVNFTNNEIGGAQACLKRGIELDPTLLESEIVKEVIKKYTPDQPVEAAVHFIEATFSGLLPQTCYLRQVESKLLSQLHMEEVFSAAGQGQYWRIGNHLWPGIRNNPGWLLNRGVLGIALRSLFRKSRAPDQVIKP